MTQQIINIGTAPADGTGDPARTAFTKSNDNFTELYSAVTSANQVFYCDLTDAADVATYKRLLLTPSTHAESTTAVICTGTGDVLVGVFITDPSVPGAIEYPAGSAYRRLYGMVSAGVARFHLQVYTRTTGGVETLVRDEFSNNFSNTSVALQEWLATPTSLGAVAATDRIVAKIYAQRVSGAASITVTFYAEGSAHASQIQTTIATGSSVPISASPPLTLAGGNLTIDLSGPPQGRLTLQTATPVMTTTQSAKTTIYYTPYVGNQIALYSGTAMVSTTFAELSVATTDTTKSPAAIGTNKVNDWFVWSDGGTLRLGHGPDWTSDTVRSAGTALAMVNGIWLNSVSITNGPAASRGTYVGTTRSNASSQLDWIYAGVAAGGSGGFLYLWNCYNRTIISTMTGETATSWTYAANTTYRAVNNSAGMRVSFVVGLEEDFLDVVYNALGAGGNGGVAIGLDSNSAFVGTTAQFNQTSTVHGCAICRNLAPVGAHQITALEYCSTGTMTFTGDANVLWLQTGMLFSLRM